MPSKYYLQKRKNSKIIFDYDGIATLIPNISAIESPKKLCDGEETIFTLTIHSSGGECTYGFETKKVADKYRKKLLDMAEDYYDRK